MSITSFTQEDVNSGLIRFVHNGGELAPAATISVDAGMTSSSAISVEFAYTPVNDTPTISAISNISVQIGQTLSPLSFMVGDAETASASLMVDAISSDTSRIPQSNIMITGTGADRAVTIDVPGGALPGTVEITLTVSDGALSSSSTFSVNLVGTPTPIATADEYTLSEDTTFSSHASGWWDNQWTVRHRLSLINLERAEDLTDFPVLVTLEPGTFDYTGTATNGADLRFVDSDETLLAHEIETWNPQGVSRVWVNVPRIDSRSNSDYLWIYSGNPTASPLPSVNIWGGVYESVYHFTEDSSNSGRLADSTGNYDGTVVGATSVTGLIGGAYALDGINQHIQLPPDSPILRNASAFSFSTWIRPEDLMGEQHVLAIGVNTTTALNDSRFSLVLNDNNLEVIVRTIDNSLAASVVTSNGPLVAGQWVYVSWTADLSTNTASLYLNGDLLGSVSNLFLQSTMPDTNSSHSSIGAQDSGTSGFYHGQVDETRLQSVSRSSEWINAEYASMTGSLVTMSGAYYQAGVLDNDTDPQNDTLTAALVSGPAHARDFSFNGFGSFTYTPTENYSGEDFFTYQTSDGNGHLSTATVTLHVTPQPDAPQAIGVLDANVQEDSSSTTLQLSNYFVDPDGDLLTYSIDSIDNSWLFSSIQIGNGSSELVFTPQSDQYGSSSVVVRATDSTGRFTTDTFQVNVASINDSPEILVNQGVSVAEGGTLTVSNSQLAASDIDSSWLTFTLTSPLESGHLELSSTPGGIVTSWTQTDIDQGLLRYVHNGSEPASVTLRFMVSDGLAAVSGSIAITIIPVNDAPVVSVNTGVTVNEGGQGLITSSHLSSRDDDSHPADRVFTITSVPAHGRLERTTASGIALSSFTQEEINAGVIRYVHDGGDTSSDALLFTLSDGTASVIGSISVTINPVNDAPMMTSHSIAIQEGQTRVLTWEDISALDSDSSTLTFILSRLTHATIRNTRINADVTSFTVADLQAGSVTITHDGSEFASTAEVEVSDGQYTAPPVAVTFLFTPVNDIPEVIGFDPALSMEDGPSMTIDLHTGFIDSEGGLLSFQVASQTNSSLLNVSVSESGILRIQGTPNGHGSSDIVIEARDSDGAIATTTIHVSLSPVNDTPHSEGESFSTTMGSRFVISPDALLANDSDIDGDRLSIVILSGPSHGTLTENADGSYTYDPAIGFTGVDSLQYAVSDGMTLSASASAILNVRALGPGTSSSLIDSSSTLGMSSGVAILNEEVPVTSETSESTSSQSLSEGTAATRGQASGTSSSQDTDSEDDNYLVGYFDREDDQEILGFAVHQRRGVDEVSQHQRNNVGVDGPRERSRVNQTMGTLFGQEEEAAQGVQLGVTESILELRSAYSSVANQEAFDEVADSLSGPLLSSMTFEVPMLAGASLTVGYVVWMLRGGMLLTSLLAQMPAWRIVDPLVVLDSLTRSEEDDESLGSLVEQGQVDSEVPSVRF
ncbi:MAG: DUF2341 domain-containing protein [Planctomycetota bacterium]|nr:MAG: DUF2341 domain-containing protein [Planctomycetota bacterium]